MLKPASGETLEVRDPESGDWAAWELRPDFVVSTEFDRHYTLNPVGGEIELGPAIRETDGGWTQYGAIPPKGAVLRFTRYRHGGGRPGNVASGSLNVMRSSLAGVDTVINPVAASGGVDAEALEHARQRAAMEIRTRYRAVTAEDFEFLAGEASPRVARAVCVPPQTTGGPVALHLVPQLFPADRQLAYGELVPDESLMQEVSEYLDERRLIGTTVQLLPCAYRGLSVVVNLQASPLADTARVEEDVVARALHVPQPAGGRQPDGPRPGLGVRARAQPGRALRRRARGRRRRVREDPAHLRDEPGDRRAELQAGRQPHRARARRADRLGAAHRQGDAPGDLGAAVADGAGNGAGGDYKTFMGAGFGTLLVQLSSGAKETPPSASSRAYLRDGLPSMYTDGDFGMRFVGALEELLDPIVAMLDALPEHFDPDYAPRHILNLLSAWLGVDLDESRAIAVQRDTIRRAAELGRRRGTKGGLELALSLAFPDVPAAGGGRGRASCGPREKRWNQIRPSSSCTATSPLPRTSKPPSHVALSSSSRYTPHTGCA